MAFSAPWHNGNNNGNNGTNGMPMQNMPNIIPNMSPPSGMSMQPPMNFMKMNQFNQGPNMVYMPPPNSNNFMPPSNQQITQMNTQQNSLVMLLERFNNFTNINGNEFIEILELITKDCSQANIQKGTKWVFDHCNTPIFIDQLGPLLIAYTQSKRNFKEKLHITYLINDVLFHSDNRKKSWIKEQMCHFLIPLFNMIYHSMLLTKEEIDSLYKIISIWETQNYFEIGFINALRNGMVSQQPVMPPPMNGPQGPSMNGPPPNNMMIPPLPMVQPPPIAQQHMNPPVNKKYYELPAGLSVLCGWNDIPYTPIKVEQITAPYQCKQPTPELLKAIDEFYSGLEEQKKLLDKDGNEIQSNTTDNESTNNKLNNKKGIIFEKEGWEKGYLNFLYDERKKQKEREKKKKEERYRSRSRSSERNRGHSRSRSHSRGRSRNRSRSRSRSRSRRRDHHSHRSHNRSTSRSRSRSRSRHHSKHSTSRTRYSSSKRSYSSDRSYSRGRRSRSRSSSGSRSSSSSRSRSRSSSSSRSRSRSRSRSKNYRDSEDEDGFPLSMSQANNFMMNSGGAGLGAQPSSAQTEITGGLDKNNIGFQMMKKLGWSGTGLGKEEKGIVEPVKGGEVRTLENKYMGIGISTTPTSMTTTSGGLSGLSDEKFEEYRKSKSYTYSRDPGGRRRRESVGCFRCGKHGHIARDCPY